MNVLAATLLLFLDEESAFWALEALVGRLLPARYYTPSMAGAVADQSVFADLLLERLPRLFVHLKVRMLLIGPTKKSDRGPVGVRRPAARALLPPPRWANVHSWSDPAEALRAPQGAECCC